MAPTPAAVRNLSLPYGVSVNGWTTGKTCCQFDSLRRDIDQSGQAPESTPTPRGRSTSSPRPRRARRSTSEGTRPGPPALRQQGRQVLYVGQKPDSPWDSEQFLLARRLVEAGVPVVTLRAGGWDHHGNVIQSQGGKNIWYSLRSALPLLDRSIHALVTDLHDRGLDKEVLVLIWGEFGRTPKISQNGRDHWPD